MYQYVYYQEEILQRDDAEKTSLTLDFWCKLEEMIIRATFYFVFLLKCMCTNMYACSMHYAYALLESENLPHYKYESERFFFVRIRVYIFMF